MSNDTESRNVLLGLFASVGVDERTANKLFMLQAMYVSAIAKKNKTVSIPYLGRLVPESSQYFPSMEIEWELDSKGHEGDSLLVSKFRKLLEADDVLDV